MARNVILIVSTLAVLLLLFAGYSSLVGGSRRLEGRSTGVAAELPRTTRVSDERKLRIAGVEVEPGEQMAYIEYGPDGRPTAYFRLQNWEKVPGTQNEVTVTEPELMMRLPSGMIVTVTAARGQIRAERVQTERLQPKLGWLAGDARIVLDRETGLDRTPLSQRPEDRITVEMERLEFDLDLGELKTDQPLRVISPEFEVTGTGLHLLWNQSDNRVEKLLINRGGEMVLRGELLASLDESLEGKGQGGGPTATTRPAPAVAPAESRRRMTAYRCGFTGGVTVDHHVGDERLGGLQADELVLLFDVGRRGRGLPRDAGATTTAPTSRPSERPERRIAVRWDGRLALGPANSPPTPEQPRRHFEARGGPVEVRLPKGSVRCGRLVLHEETRRLWLYPDESGLVELSSADKLSVKAAGVFADLESNVVKLIGKLTFKSSAGAGRGGRSLTIRSELWAELHLAADRDEKLVENVFDNPLASRPPESAVFVGDVEVEYEDQRLRAHRLEAYFRQVEEGAASETPGETAVATDQRESAGPAPALQTLLESAVATGDVRLRVVSSSGRRWRRVLEREVGVVERALVRAVSKAARRRVRRPARYEDRTLECARLRLDFGIGEGEARVRRMEGSGAVAIFDRRSRFAARGREVTATFVGREELQRATVSGTERAPALVRARAYALRGQEIKVDNQARTLRVDGRSRLAFRSRRSLQGLTRRQAEVITVTSNEFMHVDEQRNTVHFTGQVVAGTGDEELLADGLTLLLEDVEVERPPSLWSRVTGVARTVRGEVPGGLESAAAPRSFFAIERSRGGGRKELARVLARNAEIRSVVYAPGDPVPLVYQSVTGPELEIDVRRRWIRTNGETTLLMTDRRMRAGAGVGPGIPSALMSRGPSQTAMKCNRSLVYMLGEEGPQRKDSVLLQGGVQFRHVTGREMVDLERMLPQVVANPELLETLKSRNTYMECDRLEGILMVADDSATSRAALGRRPPLRLHWLNACGDVYLRDQQNAAIRTVYAHQLEFDRPNGVIRVLGSPERHIEARVYDENPETGRFNIPAIGPEIIIDLETNTVRTKEVRGQAGR